MSSSDAPFAPRYLSVDRLIDHEHPARKIWRVVERLDLSRFETDLRAVEGHDGRPSHSPQVLVSIWIYAYSRGLHSAREIARRIEHEPGLRWLTALRPINHHTLSDFRVSHARASSASKARSPRSTSDATARFMRHGDGALAPSYNV